VIVRKNKYGNDVANYLLQRGIPVISSDSLLLKNCPEVNFVLSFLSWLVNPANAVAAVAAVTYLRETSHPTIDHAVIHEVSVKPYRLHEVLELHGIHIDTTKLASLPLFELCTETLRLFGIADKNPLYLDFFLDEISNFSQRESNSVFAFLSWWKQKSDNLSVKIPANTNAVKVLTIHSSKGLEFPVVILPFADWKIDMQENILVDTHEELPALPVALVRTGGALKKTKFEGEAIEEEQKQKLDNLNLLYVACTRAVNELHILSRESSRGGQTIASWLRNFASEKYQLESAATFLEIGKSPEREHLAAQELPGLQHPSFRPIHEAVTIKLSDIEDSAGSRRMFGIALHDILANIKTREDILPALQKALLQGNIDSDQLVSLQSALEQLTSHSLMIKYFSKDVRVKTETELFMNNGDVIRPDRVAICDDHLAVLDFKTGEKKPEHIKQVEQYRYALKNVSGKDLKAFLVYFPLEVIEVV
jgi:ATP-dependent exoDNAse (exonuclease V) beta subunit